MPNHPVDHAVLTPLLELAVTSGDAQKVAELIEAGADPMRSAPSGDPKNPAPTPFWLALQAGKDDLVPLLLANHRRKAPLVFNWPRPVTVFEKLGALQVSEFNHDSAYKSLAKNLDFSTATMRSAAWGILKKSRDHLCSLAGDIEAMRVAEAIVLFGATPPKMSSVAVALEYPVMTLQNWRYPSAFASFLVRTPGSAELFRYWISRGLSPDNVAGNLPLLHYAAMHNNGLLAQVLLEAGANPQARGKSENLAAILETANRPPAEEGAWTALDVASAVGATGVARIILAAGAHSAVERVLAQARPRAE